MPKLVNHEERRASIAIGVISVMAEQGIAGVSLRSVAHAAGVSMGQVQHYFATKAALVRHACQLYIDRATGQHEETHDAPPAERVAHLLTMNIPDTAEERIGTAIWYEFVTAGTQDTAIAEMITGAWRARRRQLVELLAAVQGSASSPTTDEAADRLASASDGLAVHAMLGDISRAAAAAQLAHQLAELQHHWTADRTK